MAQSPATARRYQFDAKGRIVLDGKDAVRQRLGRSPDRGDAVALALGDARRDPTAVPPGLDLAAVNRDLMRPSKWTEDQIPASYGQPPPHLRWP